MSEATIRPFNREDIVSRFAGLTPSQLTAFIASCAFRLSDFFEAFSLEELSGDISVIRSGLAALWEYSARATRPDEGLCEAIELQHPEDRAYNSIFTPMAAYACESLMIGLEFINGKYENAAEDVAITSQTAVESYLATVNQVFQGRTSIANYASRSRHDYCALPLFAAELSKQTRDIELIRQAGTVTDATITELMSCGSLGVRPAERFNLRSRRIRGKRRLGIP
jgi:uncharacterized protein YjaG (DUF416 family)